MRVTHIQQNQAYVNAASERPRDKFVHRQSLRAERLGRHADMVTRPSHLPRQNLRVMLDDGANLPSHQLLQTLPVEIIFAHRCEDVQSLRRLASPFVSENEYSPALTPSTRGHRPIAQTASGPRQRPLGFEIKPPVSRRNTIRHERIQTEHHFAPASAQA